MLRATPKRKTVHRDPHQATTLNRLIRDNGLDLLDRHAVRNSGPMDRDGKLLPEADVRCPNGGLRTLRPRRRLSDEQVAERRHYYMLASKYEAVRAVA